MDRTKVSGTFDVGSIPAGAIFTPYPSHEPGTAFDSECRLSFHAMSGGVFVRAEQG